MTLKVRLLIGDLSLRQTLCGLLEQDPDLVVLPSTPSANDIGADLVLVDGEANLAAAVELIRSTRATHPGTRMMILVGQPSIENVHAALSAGASGVVAEGAAAARATGRRPRRCRGRIVHLRERRNHFETTHAMKR
ncbi:MAG TPA: hypothetical protein VHB97_11400 [Polyangia bacterium]|jgi:DNA-binding NarL/FixJ family response regulator|nr:hypothetical protein [Polyangia bacterium]